MVWYGMMDEHGIQNEYDVGRVVELWFALVLFWYLHVWMSFLLIFTYSFTLFKVSQNTHWR